MRPISGCGTALITPFIRGGDAVDQSALRALVSWQIAAGIDFLVACGSTGEAQTLKRKERLRVVELVLETSEGRVPVVAGATSNDTEAAVTETKAMCALGVQGILSATPYYNKPSQEGLEQHFLAVADAASCPVILYNVPGRTAVNLLPATALRLAGHPNIVGIKEASGDLTQALRIIQSRPQGFTVLSGEDALAVAMIACGGDGVISVTSNAAPGPMTTMTRLALGGDVAGARSILRRLFPLMEANFMETNPAPVKAALHLMGKAENELRLPLLPANDATRDALRSALQTATGENT